MAHRRHTCPQRARHTSTDSPRTHRITNNGPSIPYCSLMEILLKADRGPILQIRVVPTVTFHKRKKTRLRTSLLNMSKSSVRKTTVSECKFPANLFQSLAFPKARVTCCVWKPSTSRTGSEATGLPSSRANSTRRSKNIVSSRACQTNRRKRH
jgi:hypothetical protein